MRSLAFRAAWLLVLIYLLALGGYAFGITRSGLVTFATARAPQYAADFAVLGMVVTTAWIVGRLVLGRLRLACDSAVELTVNAIALGLGVLSLLMLGLGLLSLYKPWVMWVILAFGTAAGLGSKLRSSQLRRVLAAASLRCRYDELGFVEGLSLTLTAASLSYSLVVNSLVPPLAWDGIAYHLAVPRIYIAEERIVQVPFIVHSNWPFNMEMLYTLALLVGSERLPQILAFSFCVLTGCGLALFAGRYFDRRVAMLATALFFAMPVVRRESGTAMVDIPLGLYAMLSVMALWRWRCGGGRSWLILSSLFAGFAAGVKLTGASTGLLLVACLLLLTVRECQKGYRLSLVPLALFGTTSLAVVLPWYLKSMAVTGNPVWPFLDNVFASRNWDTVGTELHNTWLRSYGTGISLESLLALPWNLFMSNRLGPALGLSGIALLPAALVGFRRNRLVWYLFGFIVGSATIWFFLTQQNRFLTPALPAIALLAAAGFWWLHDAAPSLARPLIVAVLTLWAATTIPFFSDSEAPVWSQRLAHVSGQISRDEILSRSVNVYRTYLFANQNLPKDAAVLLLPYEPRGFYLERTYFWGNPVNQRIIRFEQMTDPSQLLAATKALGLTHVILNPSLDVPLVPFNRQYHDLIDRFRATYLRPLFEANGVTLYEIEE